MRPDFLFIFVGFAAVLATLGVAFYALRYRRPDQWWSVVFWAILACGLLLQGFSPHLQIKQNAFVMPLSAGGGSSEPLNPIALVNRDKFMQGFAGLLLIVACVGLGFRYRRFFMKPDSQPRSHGATH